MRTACVIACVLAGPSAATERVDRLHGMRFELNGAALTMTLVRPVNRETGRRLWGRRVDVICSPTFSLRRARRVSVRQVVRWPSGRRRLTVVFERDISDRVKWCLVESGARDIAVVSFESFVPVRATTADDRRIGYELRAYLERNADPALRRPVRAIVVDHGVIGIVTGLRREARGKLIAAGLCNLIQGSDVADFSTHAIFARDDEAIATCPARELPLGLGAPAAFRAAARRRPLRPAGTNSS